MNRVSWVFLVVLLLGVVFATGIITTPNASATNTNLDSEQAGSFPMLGLADCAGEPPADFSPPEENVLGWHDGYWYNQPLDIDTTGGLTEPELDAVIARAMARWEALRCLPFDESVPVEVIDRETFQAEYVGGDRSEETRLFENARALALFMVGQDEDAIEVIEANRGVTVGGFYSIAEEKIVLVSGAEGEIHVNEPILGHELGHALQNQHFGLEGYAGSTTDAHNANLGIVEGDVVLTEAAYDYHCTDGYWAGECVMPPEDRLPPDLASVGLFLISFQPYSDGPNFVSTLYETAGWDAVNAVYERYPSSAKTVMYPELYPDFTPVHPAYDDRSSDRWALLEHSTGEAYDHLGEPVLFASLVAPSLEDPLNQGVISAMSLFNTDPDGAPDPLNPYNYSSQFTDGWLGDRFLAYAEAGVEPGDDPALAYTLTVRFDSNEAASTFVDGWTQQLEHHGGEQHDSNHNTSTFVEIATVGGFDGAYRLDLLDDTVRIVHAPSAEALDEVFPIEEAATTPTPTADGSPGFTVALVGFTLLLASVIMAIRRS